MNPFLKLDSADNTLVALAPVSKGTPIDTDVGAVALPVDISRAHKIAACDIAKNADVLKYGMVIGVATQNIRAGDHVHIHNIASKYTPTVYRREEVQDVK